VSQEIRKERAQEGERQEKEGKESEALRSNEKGTTRQAGADQLFGSYP
jgi:hypothetical protein